MGFIATVTLNPSLDEWIHLPRLGMGRLNRAANFRRYIGGKGINVSRVIRELGGKTKAFGFAGGDDGLILRELMNDLKIPHDFVTIEGTTRNNYKIQTDFPPVLTEINTAGPRITRRNLHLLEKHLHAQDRFSCIVLSGSLPPGIPDVVYRKWIGRFKARGIRAVLDTSGKALWQGIQARPWLIKPNRQEAEEFLGRRITTIHQAADAAKALLRRGPKMVILSLGAKGAVMAVHRPSQVWLAKPPAVSVTSAVGAGDSLVGGFVFGVTQKQPLPEAFRLGVACGAASAMSPGTELCHRAVIRRLIRRVVLKKIA